MPTGRPDRPDAHRRPQLVPGLGADQPDRVDLDRSARELGSGGRLGCDRRHPARCDPRRVGHDPGRTARRHPARRNSPWRHPARRDPARRHPARRHRLHGPEPQPERPRRRAALDDPARAPGHVGGAPRPRPEVQGHASAERDARRRCWGPPVSPALNGVSLDKLNVAASPLGGIPLGGIALGGLPLGGIPLGGIAGSTETRTSRTGAPTSTSSRASTAPTARASPDRPCSVSRWAACRWAASRSAASRSAEFLSAAFRSAASRSAPLSAAFRSAASISSALRSAGSLWAGST